MARIARVARHASPPQSQHPKCPHGITEQSRFQLWNCSSIVAISFHFISFHFVSFRVERRRTEVMMEEGSNDRAAQEENGHGGA
jgi:hypothetical protein